MGEPDIDPLNGLTNSDLLTVVNSGYGQQNVLGIDLSSLRYNLILTPAERVIKHQSALALVLEVRSAAGLRPPPGHAES